jgi:GLPGLI family protein
MRFIIVVFYLFSFFPMIGNGQENLGAQAIYRFKHLRDTTNPSKVYEEKFLLQFTNTTSLYKSHAKYYDDSVFEDNMSKVRAGLSVSELGEPVRLKKSTIEQLLYQFNTDKFYFVHPWIGETLVIENPIDKVIWKLEDSSKKIGSLQCYKASGALKGRIYEVWYCPDYPVKAGPWKLNGLPGLIVEATDRTKTVSFELQLVYSNNRPSIELPAAHKKITQAKFKSLLEDLRQNPYGYLSAAMNGSSVPIAGANSTVSLNNTTSSTSKTRNIINNPLELE